MLNLKIIVEMRGVEMKVRCRGPPNDDEIPLQIDIEYKRTDRVDGGLRKTRILCSCLREYTRSARVAAVVGGAAVERQRRGKAGGKGWLEEEAARMGGVATMTSVMVTSVRQ